MKHDGSDFQDGEILGLQPDGNLVQWNADARERYTAAERPEEFGLDNMTSVERQRIFEGGIGTSGVWRPAPQFDELDCWAYIDLVRLSARTGRIPSEIPAHYVEYVQALHRAARGRPRLSKGSSSAMRTGVVQLPWIR